MNRVSQSEIKIVTLAYSILIVDIKQRRNIIEIINNIKDSFTDFYSDITLFICIQSSIKLFDQISDDLDDFISETSFDIQVIYGGIKGLSKSRNICIKALNTKYIYFLDADCRFSIRDTKNFIGFLKSQRINILFINSLNIEDNKKLSITNLIPKNFSLFLPKQLTFLIKSISVISYQIIISKNLLSNSNIYFDEKLGLGTNMTQSEEVCFLLNILKSKSKINMAEYTLDNFYAKSKSHLPNNINLDRNLISKGYVIRKILGKKGVVLIPLISLIFYLKNKPYVNIFSSLNLIKKGFFSLDN